jgi:hypothetical protein
MSGGIADFDEPEKTYVAGCNAANGAERQRSS